MYDSPFAPIVKQWLEKIELASAHKKKVFGNDAEEALKFYNGPYDFMYDKSYASSSRGFVFGGNAEMPSPSFRMTVNKAAEMVQIYGPVLYHRNPVRRVTPRESPDISGTLMQTMPMITPEMGQMLQMSQMQAQAQRGQDTGRALLYESYGNRTPWILDLKTESRLGIEEALLTGMGTLWTELYKPPGANFKIVGSFYESVRRLVIDPDCEKLDDARWIARQYIRPRWQVAQEYGWPEEMLKGAQMSHESAASAQADGDAGLSRMRNGETNDLIVYWRIYSKMGFGSYLKGVAPELQGQLEMFGPYCHLVVCKGLPYFLNINMDSMQMSPQDVSSFVEWPTPFWTDDGWPFVPYSFHNVPGEVWPMSHLKPAMGELKFLNWAYSFIAGKIRTACRDFIVAMKGVGEELKKSILRGTDYEWIELERVHGDTANDVVNFLQHPPFHGDIYKVIEAIEHNFDKRTGLTELAYGMSSRQLRSASEANLKSSQLSVRPDDMATRVEESMAELGRREALAARWHLQPEDIAPVLGQDAAFWWGQLVVASDPADTLHALDYRVEAGSARKPSKDRDQENMSQAMQALFQPLWQYAQATGNTGPVNALIQQWAKAHDFDPTPFLLPVPPPPEAVAPTPPGTNPPPAQKAQEQLQRAA